MSFFIIPRLIVLTALGNMLLSANANNVTLGEPLTTGQNAGSGTTQVQVDVSWNNSWSDAENHDGVWLFAKYRVNGVGGDGVWRHATLANSNHLAPSNLQIVQPSSKGLILKRAVQGTGNISSATVQMSWQYSTDPKSSTPGQFVGNSDAVELQVHAVEMVYVPQGPFYVGDGNVTTNTTFGNFCRADFNHQPFQITSANALTLGGTNPANLMTTRSTFYDPGDDFSAATTRLLPETFPNGYNAFYLMKYEITQEQYVKFLNTLTRQQQAARVASDISGASIANSFVLTNTPARAVDRNGVRSPQNVGSAPITFFCDMDGDGIANESDDGQNVACNHLNANDVAAYLDWSALRPMTELEYEKACRGPVHPQVEEFAWGNTTISNIISLSDFSAMNTPNESCVDPSKNVITISTGGVSSLRPGRVGIFATATSNRQQAGAGFYGAMELTGNVTELAVTVGNAAGRAFTGAQGNGELSTTGNADVPGWPDGSTSGLSRRSVIVSSLSNGVVSSRILVNNHANLGRLTFTGGRGVLNPQEID